MSHELRALAVVFALVCGGCTIGRDYVGNALRSDPHVVLHPGVTTLKETLEIFGAPDKIQRRRRGDILIYRFVRQNTSELELQEPVVTGITVFTYTKHQIKADRLTLFFDDTGTLTAFGYTSGVNELDLL
jgi:hypothetical protein